MASPVPPPPPTGPAAPVRISRQAVRVMVVVLVVLVLLAVLSVVLNRRHHQDAHRASVPLAGRQTGVVELDAGADRITVTTADLGGTLAVVTTPDGATVHPRIQSDGARLRIFTADDDQDVAGANNYGADVPSELDVRLNRTVRWDVDLTKGAKQFALDLGSGRVHSVSIAAGADHADLVLPRPDGVEVVHVVTGLGSAAFHLPSGVPVQLTFGSGAGSAVVDGQQHEGIAAGTTIAGTQGDPAAADRVDFDVAAGIGTVVLDRTAP